MTLSESAAGRGPASDATASSASSPETICPIVTIDTAWCKGCYLCVSFCPRDVLDIDAERWTNGFHPVYVKQIARCTLCRNCELLCPDLAIAVEQPAQVIED